jgi:CubicO group peptidase (beta-lactamase class C family)
MLALLSSFGMQAQKSFTTNGRKIKVKKFNKEITQLMSEVGIPGMSLAVIDNNQIVFSRNYGVKGLGGEAVDQATVFDGCSLSKSLLAYVAYQVADEGLLDLDRPVYEYKKLPELEYDERYKSITARMILSHSSGLENWSYHNNADTLELLANPGEKFVYSGEGYIYLSEIIADLLGKSYEEYITERVIEPLGMENTFLKFVEPEDSTAAEVPANYALGHQIVGRQEANKNYSVNPAGGNHFTAEDYAKLVLGIFNNDQFSEEMKKAIIEPQIQIDNSQMYYAPGYEISNVDGETIIYHGGDKDGYKNIVYYSLTKKSGLVFLINIDWGKAITRKLNEMTVNLDIEPYLESRYPLDEQYPSTTLPLMKLLNEQGYDAFFAAIRQGQETGEVDARVLNSLLHYLTSDGDDVSMTRKLLAIALEAHPNSALTIAMHARHHLNRQEFEESYDYFVKAKEMGFDQWDIDFDMSRAEKGKDEIVRRRNLLALISHEHKSVIEAEEYNEWGGIVDVMTVIDEEGNNKGLSDFDDGNWVEYKVNVEKGGEYAVTVRVLSPLNDSKLELRSGDQLLGTFEIPQSNAWNRWQTPLVKVKLPEGKQTIRLVAIDGYYIVNSLSFSPITDSSQ